MFNAELKNTGHVSGSKMVTFIMDQRSKVDASLKAIKTLIASCTELFPIVVKSSEEGESSSSYSNLTPHDMVEIYGASVEAGNQHAEEVDQVEDITMITVLPVPTTEVLVPNATPVSATVGEETPDDCHAAEVTTPSLVTDFQVVAWDSPPFAILAPGFPPDNRLSAPLAPDVVETVDRMGVILGPDGHEVSVPPPRAPSLATNRADRHEG